MVSHVLASISADHAAVAAAGSSLLWTALKFLLGLLALGAAFDTTAATPILRTKYQTKKVQSMAYKKSPALGMIPKDNDGPGDQKNFVMRYARTSGGSSVFGTAQTNAGP